VNEITNLLLVRNVNGRGKRFDAGGLLYFASGRFELRPVAGAHGDLSALSRQAERNSLADAGAGCGHNGNAIF
jgi:hypothetical protein